MAGPYPERAPDRCPDRHVRLGDVVSTRHVLLLGTSSQVPTRRRNHNGVWVSWDGHALLVDPGEGTQRQMLRYGVSAHELHAIALTHTHGDHCLGLPGVIQRLSLDRVPHPVALHAARTELPYVERLRYASRYVEVAEVVVTPHDAPGPIGAIGGATLSTAPLSHSVPTWGYRLQEPDGWTVDPERARAAGLQGPEIGQLVRGGVATGRAGEVRIRDVATPRRGQSVAVVMDTRPCDGALALADGVDVLVCESTYTRELQAEAHERGHMTAADAARLAAEAGVGTLVLTQFSQRYPDEQVFADEARALFDDVVAAHDGLVVPLPSRRTSTSTP